jgi:plasmid stabilization system protein ParE
MGNIIISKSASSDLKSIVQWYDDRKDDLGNDFLFSFNKILIAVQKNPTSFRYISKHIRRCKTRKFPYHIYYRITGTDVIRILRVRHVKQALLKRFT